MIVAKKPLWEGNNKKGMYVIYHPLTTSSLLE